jgi:IclR family pca regulon transcriptional regulator
MRDKNFIQSLARGLKILELFGESSRALTLTEIAGRTGLTKTTIQRFLHTLCSLGYLHRDENKSYVLGVRVLSFGHSFLNTSNLVRMARPYLDELSSELGKTVNLAILDDLDTLFLYHREVRKFLKYDLGPGSRLPAYAGSLGKVLLAGLNDEELNRRMRKMDFYPITPRTILSKRKLWAEIKETRERGYSICDKELSMDMYSIGVPLLNGQGEVVAAINASLEASYKGSPDLKGIIEGLMEKGKMISSSLGYHGSFPSFPR